MTEPHYPEKRSSSISSDWAGVGHPGAAGAWACTYPIEGAGAAIPIPVLVLPSREGMPPPRTVTTSGSLRASCVML